MNAAVERSATILNEIFKASGARHLSAHPTRYGQDEALRIIYRGVPLASPQADLKGEDRRRVASAFLKAGFAASEYPATLRGANAPALLMECYTPPADMHWTVARGHIHPWTLYVLRPDAAYLDAHAGRLAEAMRVRFTPPGAS